MATIAFFELEDWEKEYTRQKLAGHILEFIDAHASQENIARAKDADVIACFIYSQFTKELLLQIPKTKLITTMSTGFDHIDLQTCREKNILVANVPSYGENTVAEHAFALLLALSRKIVPSVERTRKINFDLEGLRGFDLKGKTIGVIGTGKIGQHLIRMAKGFDMNIVAFDVFPNKTAETELGFTYLSLPELLAKSDIISLHAPYNQTTHHLINKNNISQIKKGAVLINTARGGLVETDALVLALQEGILSYAGLDVLEEENFVKEERQLLTKQFQKNSDLHIVLEDHELLSMENVLVTPHNAFNSTEALKRILDTTLENIISFLNEKPINIIK